VVWAVAWLTGGWLALRKACGEREFDVEIPIKLSSAGAICPKCDNYYPGHATGAHDICTCPPDKPCPCCGLPAHPSKHCLEASDKHRKDANGMPG
jgi:hypothetical protein